MGCQSIAGLPPSIKFASTHLYTWLERGTVRVKCLDQEHNTMSPARARTQTAHSRDERANREAIVPRVLQIVQVINLTIHLPIQFNKQLVKGHSRVGLVIMNNSSASNSIQLINEHYARCMFPSCSWNQTNKRELYPSEQKLETLNMTLMEIGVHWKPVELNHFNWYSIFSRLSTCTCIPKKMHFSRQLQPCLHCIAKL